MRNALDEGLSHKERFALAVVRPTKMLFCSPIVAIMSLYTAVIYGTLYLLFTTITFVFEDIYKFSSSMVGLAYLGVGIGMLLGLPIAGKGTDLILQRRKAEGLELKPEHRLDNRLVLPGACAVPVGLFIYGWTTKYHVHWIVPLIGTAFLGFGMILCTVSRFNDKSKTLANPARWMLPALSPEWLFLTRAFSCVSPHISLMPLCYTQHLPWQPIRF